VPTNCGTRVYLQLAILLVAGLDTTMSFFGNGFGLLLDNPDLLTRLRDQPKLIEGYVNEMLRLEPPVQMTTRISSVDTEIEGEPVPAGTPVTVLIAAANRDPRRFDRPNCFDPDRALSKSLTFGAGPHFCLGSKLALQEAVTAFSLLVTTFSTIARAGAGTRARNAMLRTFEELPVHLET
jgi:cytochrome P450